MEVVFYYILTGDCDQVCRNVYIDAQSLCPIP